MRRVKRRIIRGPQQASKESLFSPDRFQDKSSHEITDDIYKAEANSYKQELQTDREWRFYAKYPTFNVKTTVRGIMKPDDPMLQPLPSTLKEKEKANLDSLYDKTFNKNPQSLFHVYKRRALQDSDPRKAHTSARDRRIKAEELPKQDKDLSSSLDNKVILNSPSPKANRTFDLSAPRTASRTVRWDPKTYLNSTLQESPMINSRTSSPLTPKPRRNSNRPVHTSHCYRMRQEINSIISDCDNSPRSDEIIKKHDRTVRNYYQYNDKFLATSEMLTECNFADSKIVPRLFAYKKSDLLFRKITELEVTREYKLSQMKPDQGFKKVNASKIVKAQQKQENMAARQLEGKIARL